MTDTPGYSEWLTSIGMGPIRNADGRILVEPVDRNPSIESIDYVDVVGRDARFTAWFDLYSKKMPDLIKRGGNDSIYLRNLILSYLEDKFNVSRSQMKVRFLLSGVKSDDRCAEISSQTTKTITGRDFVVPLIEAPLSVVEQVLGKGCSSGLQGLPYEILSRGEVSSSGEQARPAMIVLMANDMKLSNEERLRRVAELSAAMVDPLQGRRKDPIMDAIVRIIGSYAGDKNTQSDIIRVNPERIIPLISEKIPELHDEDKNRLARSVVNLIASLSSMMTDRGKKIPFDEIFRRLMLCPNLSALHKAVPELEIPEKLL